MRSAAAAPRLPQLRAPLVFGGMLALFVELERKQALARTYEVEYGQLQIEQSTWAMPARIEKIARDHLRMQVPGASRVELLDEGKR